MDVQGLVPSGVKVDQPTVFTGIHSGTDVRNFINACNAYFKLLGIEDENTHAMFVQMHLVDTAWVWFDG